MKIAILADPLDTQSAGIHQYTQGLISGLTKIEAGHEYLIVRPESGLEFPNSRELIVPIRKGIPLHARWRQFTSIPNLLKKEGVDLVIEPAHFGPFNLPQNIKRVTVIHDLTPIKFPAYHGRLSYWMHKYLLPRVLRKTDYIITVSESTRRDLIHYFPFTEKKSKAILLGRNKIYKPTENPSILKKYNIQNPYFLSVSTLEPRKNLSLLVEAYNRFRAINKGVIQLVLVGKRGWKTKALLQKIEDSPYRTDILLTGFVPQADLAILYSHTSAFVYPSWYEGFGIPVLEAMSCGAVVLSSDSSSLPEVGGKAALYFSSDSASQLLDLLQIVVQDEWQRKRHSALSLQRAEQFYWERMAKEILSYIGNEIT